MLQYRNMVCNTFMPRNHVCCLSPLHPPPQITVSDKGIWRLRHNVNKSSLSLILFAMMPFQTEIVGPVGLFSMNLIMVFETQFITIWSSNWWGWIKSIRSLKPYTETGPHGAPTWSSLWKKNLWCCFRGWSFLVNVPFLAVKLVEVQAFLFSYTKPCPILKEIIAFKLYQHTDSVDWNNNL